MNNIQSPNLYQKLTIFLEKTTWLPSGKYERYI